MRDKLPVVFGGLAIILWGTLIVASRALCNQVGHMEAAALVYSAAMICVVIQGSFSTSLWRQLASLPRKYLTVCGLLFTLYNVCFYCAVGWASTEEQVAAVAIVNYLWPPLTIVLSVPILRYRAKMSFVLAGSGIAFLGAALAVWSSAETNLQGIGRIFQAPLGPLALAFLAAVSWALYSNCSALWASQSSGVPAFIVFTGVVLSPFLYRVEWGKVASPSVLLLMLFLALFPTYLAYYFWDYAQRKGRKERGDQTWVNLFSYAIPLLSLFALSISFAVHLPSTIWIASLLVIVGAALSKIGIEQKCVTRITMSDHLGARQ